MTPATRLYLQAFRSPVCAPLSECCRDSSLSGAPAIVFNGFEYFPFKVYQVESSPLPPSSRARAGVSVNMTSSFFLCLCVVLLVSAWMRTVWELFK